MRKRIYHSVLVLGRRRTIRVEIQSFFNLLPQRLTELRRRVIRETIDSGCNRALICQEAGNASLVLGAGSADEGRVVDEAVFRGVALGFQRSVFLVAWLGFDHRHRGDWEPAIPEQRLLGTEDLHCGSGVLG